MEDITYSIYSHMLTQRSVQHTALLGLDLNEAAKFAIGRNTFSILIDVEVTAGWR